MICLVGKLPVLEIGRHQVAGYDTDWIDLALQRAAESCDRADFPFIDDIRDGVLHYLEYKLLCADTLMGKLCSISSTRAHLVNQYL